MLGDTESDEEDAEEVEGSQPGLYDSSTTLMLVLEMVGREQAAIAAICKSDLLGRYS